MTTQPLAVVMDSTYEIEFWVKGQGDIRTGIFDGDLDGQDYGYEYASYITVNTSTWENHVQTVTADTTQSAGEFIISVRNTVAGSDLEIDSMVVRFGVAQPAATVSIYDIQYSTGNPADSPYNGQTVSTGGIVTYVRADGNFYLQSGLGPWSGVYVFDGNYTVAVGDSVTFDAEVDEYFDLTELKNLSAFTNVSSGNFFMSNAATSTQANSEEYEGCLVSVTGANCTNDNAGFGEWTIDDGSGPVNVDDFLYLYTATTGLTYDVRGLVDYAFSEFKILPRDANDVNVSVGIGENEINFEAYPNPIKNILTIEYDGEANIQIIDVAGRTVLSTIKNQKIINLDVSGLNSGNYFLNINGSTTKLIKF